MPTESLGPDFEDDRADGLIAALRQSARPDLHRLLALHPNVELLRRRWSDLSLPTLREMLIAELGGLEKQWLPESQAVAQFDMPAVDFWLRKQRLTQLLIKRQQLYLLPRLWQAMATLSAADVRQLSEDLGIDAVAALSTHLPNDVLKTLLSALGDTLTRRVSDSIAFGKGQSVSRSVGNFLLGIYTTLAQTTRGPSLARRLGRSVMSICYGSLPEKHVKLVALCANTNLGEALSASAGAVTSDPQVLETAELLLRHRVRIYVADRDRGSEK